MSKAGENINAIFRAGISLFAEENAQTGKARRFHSAVIAGLDPAIQLLANRMDGRVKPGRDAVLDDTTPWLTGLRCALMA